MVMGGGFLFFLCLGIGFAVSLAKNTVTKPRFLSHLAKGIYAAVFLPGDNANTPLFIYTYSSGTDNFAILVLLTLARGYLCQRFKILNLTWINASCISGTAFLFMMMAVVNMYSPDGCDSVTGISRELVDYQKSVDFVGEHSIPRYFSTDPEEEVLVVINRTGGMSQPGGKETRV
jgi:hypothetical protein